MIFDVPVAHLKLYHFTPLQQAAFLSLEHAASLKGFLKPFKGKRELIDWSDKCDELRDSLILVLMREIMNQINVYPFALLPIELSKQTTGAGTAFLRWRKSDRSAMGVHLFDDLVLNLLTPDHLIDDLYAIEVQRVVINMQVSLVHTLSRQAKECAEKIAHAEKIYLQRKQKLNLEK